MPPIPRSVSISGRLMLDMHSLNNEGGEGNQIQTRMVHIVDEAGDLQVVNAISGDMLKHIQAEHFWSLATASEGVLPLCAGCVRFSANRVNDDAAFFEDLVKGTTAEATVTRVIQRCSLDDVEGILITRDNRSVPRKSAVEFGWAVGLPERTRTEQYFHVKYVPERGAGSGDVTGANVGQNIFYRPANSGVYALVCMVELNRVGWNDISRQPVVDAAARRARQKALLQSVLYTVVRTNGAQRNTQHPHVLGFEGVVSWSTTATPAPTVSALAGSYQDQMVAIGEELNRLDAGAVSSRRVASSAGLAAVLADLIEQL
jgi:CRISPR-associated protein Cst2